MDSRRALSLELLHSALTRSLFISNLATWWSARSRKSACCETPLFLTKTNIPATQRLIWPPPMIKPASVKSASTKPASNGLWISELNDRADVRKSFATDHPVKFYDTTLRDGEQSVGVVLTPEHKLEIARALDGLGVGLIEAGFPRVSSDDAEAFEAIANAGLKAEIWGFGRAIKADIDELLRLGARATVIETPTSEIKLKAYGLSVEEAKRRAAEAITYARENGVRVAFFP